VTHRKAEAFLGIFVYHTADEDAHHRAVVQTAVQSGFENSLEVVQGVSPLFFVTFENFIGF
jgi:hypothetical protein